MSLSARVYARAQSYLGKGRYRGRCRPRRLAVVPTGHRRNQYQQPAHYRCLPSARFSAPREQTAPQKFQILRHERTPGLACTLLPSLRLTHYPGKWVESYTTICGWVKGRGGTAVKWIPVNVFDVKRRVKGSSHGDQSDLRHSAVFPVEPVSPVGIQLRKETAAVVAHRIPPSGLRKNSDGRFCIHWL